jgi:hypothetical protein
MTAPRSTRNPPPTDTWRTFDWSEHDERIEPGTLVGVAKDWAYRDYVCRILGPEVSALPLQGARMEVGARGDTELEAAEHGNAAYRQEVKLRQGRLDLVLTTPRAPRVFSCIL